MNEARKAEWLRISVLIKEANEISKSLGKNTVFRRGDSFMDDTDPIIRVHNTKLRIVTTWDLDKFEERLEQMRDIYRTQVSLGENTATHHRFFFLLAYYFPPFALFFFFSRCGKRARVRA